jgi:hypothetical protein
MRRGASVVLTVLVVAAAELLTTTPAWAKDSNFGGYAAPVVATVSADITVPASSSLDCTTPSFAGVDLWVALTRGEYPANGGVNIDCEKGQPIAFASGAAGAGTFRFPVNGGDVISVSASETASQTTVTTTDTTTGVTDTLTYLGASTGPTVAQFGATTTTKTLPIFGDVTYSSCMVDGSTLTASQVTARKLVHSHQGVVPGAFSGGSFTLTEP